MLNYSKYTIENSYLTEEQLKVIDNNIWKLVDDYFSNFYVKMTETMVLQIIPALVKDAMSSDFMKDYGLIADVVREVDALFDLVADYHEDYISGLTVNDIVRCYEQFLHEVVKQKVTDTCWNSYNFYKSTQEHSFID